MRQGHYQTPGRYQNTGDLQQFGYEELPVDFLGQPSADYYGNEAGMQSLDRRLSKQLSLGSFPGQSNSGQEFGGFCGWPGDEGVDEYDDRRIPRHSRSVSLGVAPGFGSTSSDGMRRSQQSTQNYQPQGQYNNLSAPSWRGGRFSGVPSFAGRGPTPQTNVPPGMGRGEGERGQGYRKLWQQVTKVGRGQKLGDNPKAVPFSDMTVEDLIRIVRNLPPEESAIQAVSRGLYYLDSRALAAMLKELHKVGLSNRAAELFDWLRGLPEGHELAHLCDVYTYTTIISQCGSHQQLRKALELVAEMRGRGIPCNVHTYSALMNVCIKANELELALDVYNQLLREGCTPNLVTYNILIDVHGKTGQWHDAVKVLDALENQGTKPEVRTYNTIINACNRSGQPEFALKVYERMIADGAQPTATTYTALISAYGKTGKVEEAIQIFQDMVARNCERNVITYSSLISACEKAGRWQLALDLFNEMHRDSCKPNVVTYNALIAACGQGGQWETAAEIFEGMLPNQCKPDSVTYGTLISAFEKGGQWGRALQAFEEMQNQGHRPDVGVFNVLVEALCRSGIHPANLKATQLFHTASRQGQFRMMPQGQWETSVVAFTVGAATLALLQWLQDVRTKSGRNGATSPNPWSPPGSSAATGAPSSAAQSSGATSPSDRDATSANTAPERASLLLLKGKHGRSESPPAAVEEACSAILIAAGVPHALTQIPLGIRVEVGIGSGQAWQESNEVEAVLAPLSSASSRKLPPAQKLVEDDQRVEARCTDAFAAVQAFEESHTFSSKTTTEEERRQRHTSVGMLVNLAHSLQLGDDTLHDSVLLLDRLCRGRDATRLASNPVILVAISRLAAQQGPHEHVPSDSVVESVVGCSATQVAEMQESLRTALDGDTGSISPWRVLHLYFERLAVDFQDAPTAARLAGNARHMMADAIYEAGLMDFSSSIVAAAVLYQARRKAGWSPHWPQALAQLTGYTDPKSGSFAAAIEAAAALTPQLGSISHLLLVPSPVPVANSSSLGGISPPLSHNSLPSLPSYSALAASAIRRSASGSQGLRAPQNSGLQATLSGPPSLSPADPPSGTHSLVESAPSSRTPSVLGSGQSAAIQKSVFPSSTQLL